MEFKHINVPGIDEPLNEPAPVTPKKGRGRPRKDQSQPKQQTQPQPQPQPARTPNPDASNIFDQIKAEIDTNQQQQEQFNSPAQGIVESQTTQPSFLLDGYMLLAFTDAIIPEVIKMLFKKKLANVDTSNIMLNEKQKKSLEPLADEMSRQISGYINPMYAFLIASGAMYYQNAKKYA
jgi:hypothetical protein